jgi:hypothetical protein
MGRLVVLLLVMALGAPASLLAQAPAQPPPAPSARTTPSSVDVEKLGVDLSRIKRELAEPASQESSDSALKLSFTVQVIGVAPKIDFLRGFAIDGPIPYGAPTHSEIVQVLTPQAYRSPVVPISSLAMIAAQKLFQHSKKQKCEAEIEEYRQLIMRGVAVTAPRCSQ